MTTDAFEETDLDDDSPQSRLVLGQYEGLKPIHDFRKLPEPNTPNDWLSFQFPAEARKYGPPILEETRTTKQFTTFFLPVTPNIDFLAGILGNEKCQCTVWHQNELQWYRKDPTTNQFNPATDEELKLTLSQLFIRCAQKMSYRVNIGPLFREFRSEESFNQVLQRAKAVLKIDEQYFSPDGPNSRNASRVPSESVRLFVDRNLQEQEEGMVTLRDCFDAYQEFSRLHRLPSVAMSQFQRTIVPHIRRRFNRGIRRDLDRYGATRCLGWKGVICTATEEIGRVPVQDTEDDGHDGGADAKDLIA